MPGLAGSDILPRIRNLQPEAPVITAFGNDEVHRRSFKRMEAIMRCGRCDGIMVFEKFYSQENSFFGWRCLYCGEIIDKVILENRLAQSR
jgi:hypothetical protein